ncbi:hypothetical protein DEO72_LG1g1871 [Vigna unguiculata]|uniref:Uncharacterized protein n=1 Tax=Vigna unguiculata TaxID=3917 RepID=A0A4D6KSX1_VIGUN|nr:hypothetical protein DEO72_LG1g1871 [Vigna unguiculata]
MVLCFPSTPKKLGMTITCFLSGAAILAAGVHFSYVNVAPQQARTKARNEFVMETLKKKYGYTSPYEKLARSDSHDRRTEVSTRDHYTQARNGQRDI